MSEEKLKDERTKAKEGMKSLRNRKSREENDHEREAAKRRMRILREGQIEGFALKEKKPAIDDWYERLGARSKATMKEKSWAD